MKSNQITVEEAAGIVADDATIAIGGAGYRMVPEELLEAICERFVKTGRPRGLRVIALAVIERSKVGVGGAGTGLHLLAQEGLMTELICSSLSRGGNELNALVRSGACSASTLPMGTILELLRCAARGAPGFMTQVGIGTYIDPREDGGRQGIRPNSLDARIVDVQGDEYIYYPRMGVDVGMIKATSLDTRGNLFADDEGYQHSTIYTAMAAKNSGGTVIAQAERLIAPGSIHPRFGVVPAPMIDHHLLTPRPFGDEHEVSTTGRNRVVLDVEPGSGDAKQFIADTILEVLPENACVNVGAGIGMYVLPDAAVRAGREDIYFTIEQGPMGGYPRPGGVARNVEIILDQLPVFDFYEGGGPDVTVLSFAEVDGLGRVNVSRFGDRITGGGGFPNITHGARDVLFCGSFRAGNLVKFVPAVQQVTCDASRMVERGCRVRFVTDVGVLELTHTGFELRSVAPGIDPRSDVLAHVPFKIALAVGV